MLIWLGPITFISPNLSFVWILLLHHSVERAETCEFNRQSLKLPPASLPTWPAVDWEVQGIYTDEKTVKTRKIMH